MKRTVEIQRPLVPHIPPQRHRLFFLLRFGLGLTLGRSCRQLLDKSIIRANSHGLAAYRVRRAASQVPRHDVNVHPAIRRLDELA